MGRLTVRIYLDAEVIIYLIEQNPQFAPRVEAWLLANPGDLVSSELGRMETLVVPVRNADARRIADFERFFATQVAEFVPLMRDIFDKAVEIRAGHRAIRTPDAIHLASAALSGCDVFLSNDPQLQRFTGIRVEMI
jgi:predicted nucleic acid-binding protein